MIVQDVIDLANARSRRFAPGATATNEELVPVVQDSLHALFQIGARINPAFYGGSEAVPYSAPGWARPEDAEAIISIERADGEEVITVPRDQLDADDGFPSVYRWGQVFIPAGVTPGPDAGEVLTFFYSRRPATLTLPADTIDAAFPESHRTLLDLDVAVRIAIKDGGPTAEVLAFFGPERTEALKRYIAFLEHETANERRSYGLVRKFSTNTLVPLTTMLAGGAA